MNLNILFAYKFLPFFSAEASEVYMTTFKDGGLEARGGVAAPGALARERGPGKPLTLASLSCVQTEALPGYSGDETPP